MRTLLLLLTLVIAQPIFSQDIFHPGNTILLKEEYKPIEYISQQPRENNTGNRHSFLEKQTVKKSLLYNSNFIQSKHAPLPDERIDPGNFAIQIDQDFLFRFPFSKNEDRNYTQGTAFTYSQPNLIKSFFFWPLRKIAEDKKKANTHYSTSLSIGATAFTPRIIDSINPVIGDRPFAFLFFISTSTTFIRQKNIIRKRTEDQIIPIDVYHTFNITYGMFGTRLGYEFQSFAHKTIVKGRPTDPKGWKHQISSGGCPTILLEYNRFRPLISLPAKEENAQRIFDLGWNLGGSIGYYDRLFTGFYARLGLLKNYNQARWNGGWSSLNGASYEKENPEKVKKSKPEIFLYGKLNTVLMFRNSMLLGQTIKKSEYTLEPSWPKTALLEYEWGIVCSIEKQRIGEQSPRTWAAIFRTVYRSPEFDSRIFPVRWHYFGSIGLLIPVH